MLEAAPRYGLEFVNLTSGAFRGGTNMAQQTAEHRINPSEEVIRLEPLRVHFLITGENSFGQHCGVRTDGGRRGTTDGARP